jgi:hypothetical protein
MIAMHKIIAEIFFAPCVPSFAFSAVKSS